jgi:phosphopantetheinyl transferase
MTHVTSINIIYLDFSRITENTLKDIASVMSFKPQPGITNEVYNRTIASQWLISVLLKRMGNDTNITYGEFGKPYVASGVHFNISHSNTLIIAAASFKGPVGIDIEFIRDVEWQEYQTSFSPREWEIIQASSNPSREMLTFWTKMESVVKADGRGLQLPFTDIKIERDSAFVGDNLWHTKPIQFPGYACHVCSAYPIEYINIDRLVTILPA